MKNDQIKIEQFVIGSLLEVFEKIIATDNMPVKVLYNPTNYVTVGGLYKIRTPRLESQIWVGLNGPRFFFITYVEMLDKEKAKEIFSFCFGGAKRVGWEFSYEPVNDNILSVWGTLMTDKALPLASSDVAINDIEATKEGCFWLTDIGMMTQSFVRTCERNDIHSSETMSPAPL